MRRLAPRSALLLPAVLMTLGCSVMIDPSGIEPEAPAVPSGLVAVAGNGQATLHWNPLEGDVAHVDVFVGTTSGALTQTLEAPAGSTQLDVPSLTNGTLYYFAVVAVDSAGTSSALSEEASAMPFVPDTTPPSLGTTLPANAATGVAVDTTVTVNFSEPMDVGSVTVTSAPSVALGAPAWNETATQVVFTPPSPLVSETAYTVTVTGSDGAGNPLSAATFSFTTVGVPPTVQSTTPSSGASDIPPATDIVLVFSEPMNQASVQGAFSLPGVTCAWTWPNATLATCSPTVDLAWGTSYSATLGVGATDLAGNALSSAYAFSFTTATEPDVIKPTVATTAPAAGGTGAARSTNVSVTFSEPVDKASAQAAFQILAPSGHSAGVFTWSTDGLTMTFNPDVDFDYGTYVSCRVSTAVRDLAGNYLAANKDFSFTVIRQNTATLYSVASLDGFLWSSTSSPYTVGTFFYTGDNSINAYSRSFVAFDLGLLPSTTTAITAATLYVYQESLSSAPYSTLGSLYVERVDYGTALDTTDMSLAPLQHYAGFTCTPLPCHGVYANDLYTISTTTTTGWKSAIVTTSAANAWVSRTTYGNRCQFRMRFGTPTDSDAANDWAVLTSGDAAANKPYLLVTYEHP